LKPLRHKRSSVVASEPLYAALSAIRSYAYYLKLARCCLRDTAMNKPEWYDVLRPHEARIAGVVGLAVVWPLTYYAIHKGYLFHDYSPLQQKNLGTAIDVLGFAVPYWFVKWLLERQ
jgi:hypothetical protein